MHVFRVFLWCIYFHRDVQTKIDLDGKKCAHQENVSFSVEIHLIKIVGIVCVRIAFRRLHFVWMLEERFENKLECILGFLKNHLLPHLFLGISFAATSATLFLCFAPGNMTSLWCVRTHIVHTFCCSSFLRTISFWISCLVWHFFCSSFLALYNLHLGECGMPPVSTHNLVQQQFVYQYNCDSREMHSSHCTKTIYFVCVQWEMRIHWVICTFLIVGAIWDGILL